MVETLSTSNTATAASATAATTADIVVVTTTVKSPSLYKPLKKRLVTSRSLSPHNQEKTLNSRTDDQQQRHPSASLFRLCSDAAAASQSDDIDDEIDLDALTYYPPKEKEEQDHTDGDYDDGNEIHSQATPQAVVMVRSSHPQHQRQQQKSSFGFSNDDGDDEEGRKSQCSPPTTTSVKVVQLQQQQHQQQEQERGGKTRKKRRYRKHVDSDDEEGDPEFIPPKRVRTMLRKREKLLKALSADGQGQSMRNSSSLHDQEITLKQLGVDDDAIDDDQRSRNQQ